MKTTMVRGIRGAISVSGNTPEEIKSATKELLQVIIEENQLDPDYIASAIFTVTRDLNAEFPAAAARELGWLYVPLMCATEIDVPGGTQGIVRVLLHVNTTKSPREIRHIYRGRAVKLRPDLSESGNNI
ncbi:MAG: chorismate mutase [Bacillota bacterium]